MDEFKVTHPCDDVKIARIRAMNVGAIEIDLSQYRDWPLDEISDGILYKAPRTWLHNPREPDARQRLAQRARQRAEDREREVEEYRAKYRLRVPAAKVGGACETALRRDELNEPINLEGDGTGCSFGRNLRIVNPLPQLTQRAAIIACSQLWNFQA